MTYLIATLLFVIAVCLVFYVWKYSNKPQIEFKTESKMEPKSNINSSMLILQAYERLITFSERIGFKKLIERLSSDILPANEQANVYIEAIRNEYEYNLSQQIYVSDKSWQMVSDFKDQQIFIIGQLLNAISKNAQGPDLAKAMIEYLKADERASLQSIVLETLRFEARQQF